MWAYVDGRPADMRKFYDGLYAVTRHALSQDHTSGHLIAFIKRRADQASFRIPIELRRR